MWQDFFGNYQMEVDYVVRILYAGFLGSIFGVERMLREKEAGIRTHFVVAIGACLMMLISKYGFLDMAEGRTDASRIASQIVSGVGFIGAGMIIYQRESLHGLTTAAGIWLVAGIGMAVGAGLYLLPTVVCVLVILLQTVLHYNIRRLHRVTFVSITFEYSAEAAKRIKDILKVNSFIGLKLSKNAGVTNARVTVRTNEDCTDELLAETMRDPSVIAVNRIGGE